MRRFALGPVFAAVLLTFLVPTGHAAPDPAPTPTPTAGTHPASESVKKELTTVIEAQLTAFRANDYTKAFSFASTNIQGMFAPEDFEKMVKAAYPVIAHSTSANYGMAFDTGVEGVINVRVQNADKQEVEYQYLLKKEDGGWKINGVTEVKPDGLSV